MKATIVPRPLVGMVTEAIAEEAASLPAKGADRTSSRVVRG